MDHTTAANVLRAQRSGRIKLGRLRGVAPGKNEIKKNESNAGGMSWTLPFLRSSATYLCRFNATMRLQR